MGAGDKATVHPSAFVFGSGLLLQGRVQSGSEGTLPIIPPSAPFQYGKSALPLSMDPI